MSEVRNVARRDDGDARLRSRHLAQDQGIAGVALVAGHVNRALLEQEEAQGSRARIAQIIDEIIRIQQAVHHQQAEENEGGHSQGGQPAGDPPQAGQTALHAAAQPLDQRQAAILKRTKKAGMPRAMKRLAPPRCSQASAPT